MLQAKVSSATGYVALGTVLSWPDS